MLQQKTTLHTNHYKPCSHKFNCQILQQKPCKDMLPPNAWHNKRYKPCSTPLNCQGAKKKTNASPKRKNITNETLQTVFTSIQLLYCTGAMKRHAPRKDHTWQTKRYKPRSHQYICQIQEALKYKLPQKIHHKSKHLKHCSNQFSCQIVQKQIMKRHASPNDTSLQTTYETPNLHETIC